MIIRASHVEPDRQGRWLADLSPVAGPVLGTVRAPQRGPSTPSRAWLERHWLVPAC